MVLNNFSYVHKKIRFLLYLIEQESGMKLLTDLNKDFDVVLFANELQHLRIDYLHNMVAKISVRITPRLHDLIDDAMINLRWLASDELKYGAKAVVRVKR